MDFTEIVLSSFGAIFQSFLVLVHIDGQVNGGIGESVVNKLSVRRKLERFIWLLEHSEESFQKTFLLFEAGHFDGEDYLEKER